MGFVPRSQPLEFRGVILNVYARRNEIFRDEPCDAVIRIDLGIQPGTAASHRSGAEIEEHLPPLAARFFQNFVDVVSPVDFHSISA